MALGNDDLIVVQKSGGGELRKSTVSGLLALNTSANDGQINIDGGDGITASGDNATANQAGDTTRTLSIDETWLSTWLNANHEIGDGNININGGDGITATGQNAKANQSGDTTRNLAIDETWLSTWLDTNHAIGNGALTIKTAGEGASATGTFTANQSGASELTLPTIRYADLSGTPTIPAAANDGQINIDGGDGITATGDNATADQAGNTTRTLAVDNTVVRTTGDQSIAGVKTFTGTIGTNSSTVIQLENLPSLP